MGESGKRISMRGGVWKADLSVYGELLRPLIDWRGGAREEQGAVAAATAGRAERGKRDMNFG